MAGGLSDLLSAEVSALRLRETRGEVLASNIANADTPNYKARDINFAAAMQKAMGQSSQGGLQMAATSSGHLGGSKAADAANAPIQFRTDQMGSIDGNNVDTDNERMQFADNSVRYEATVTLVTAQIRNMLAVIQN